MSRRPASPPGRAERTYARLLLAYPAAFRDEYASEMQAVFGDRLREARARHGRGGVAGLWAAVLWDTAATAFREHVDQLQRDARDGWRALTRRAALPSTVAAASTLALGTGAVTVIFSVVYAVLLAPLPYRDPERIVRLWDTNATLDLPKFASSVPNFVDWRARARSFTALAALRDADANLGDGGNPERVVGVAASAELWELLGVEPIIGRTFTPDEDRPGGPPVIVLSEGLWRRRFAADPHLPGRSITVNGTAHTVVGVVPQDSAFASEVDAWLPLAADPAHEARGDRQLAVLGRLAPGVTVAQADEEMDRIAAALEQEQPSRDRGWRVRVAPLREWLVSSTLEARLWLLLGAVALLLLIACTNVANLQLASSLARRQEIGLRMALGANRRRIVRLLVVESALLAALGGAAGLALAAGLVRLLPALAEGAVPRSMTVTLNAPVLLVALAATAMTTLVFGVLPAALAARTDPQHALGQAGRALAGTRATPVQRALVGVQLALAMMLAVGATLLLQSLSHLEEVPLGFDADRVLTARVFRPDTSGERHAQALAFYEAVLAEVRALPGVQAAGFANAVPFGEGDTSMSITPVPRGAHIPEQGLQASWRIATPGYLDALGVRLVRGRLFEAARDPQQPIVLSRALTDRLWPDGEDPIGREVLLANGRQFRVVAVVGDIRQLGLDQPLTPTMYFPATYFLWPTMTLAVRTAAEPATLAAAVRAAVGRVDPAQPLFEVQPMRALVRASTAQPRLNAMLFAAFAVVALLLAAVGVAGVVACSVARRTRELAVRLALGAPATRIVRDVVGQGLRMSLAGVLGGLVAAAALARLLSGLLFGVEPHEPPVYAVAAVALLAAALLASWLPARRVARIDPIQLLRGE